MTVTAENLAKRYGPVLAVDDLSFTARPGAVTAFLGPNGAGKTTTMRMLLGLVTPTSGRALIEGREYAGLPDPSGTVGAVLDAAGFHPAHTAREHLRVYAAMGGHDDTRVTDLLTAVDLTGAADRRTRGYSTGMRRRLALATALLGEPSVLLLDEPGNGLDPEGMHWLRGFLRDFADSGRTVLVSSHALDEVRRIADDVVIIRSGRLVASGPLDDGTDLEDLYVRSMRKATS